MEDETCAAPDAPKTSSTGSPSHSAASDASSGLSSSDNEGPRPFDTIEQKSSTASSSAGKKQQQVSGFSARWAHTVRQIHRPILRVLHFLARFSAKQPKKTITGVVSLSLFLLLIGYNTNFQLNVEEGKEATMWTSQDSLALKHSNWLSDESGFIDYKRGLVMLLHADGKNVLTREYFTQLFEVFDTMIGVEGFDEACTGTDYEYDGKETCEMGGAVRFWKYNSELYHLAVSNDEELRLALSEPNYPDGGFVDPNFIMGLTTRDNTTNVLQSALSYTIGVSLPDHQDARDWEERTLNRILALIDEWNDDPTKIVVTVQSTRAYAAEFERGIFKDLPLVPLVFSIMAIFTCAVFARKNRVFSRSFLGFGAVVAVLLSIMASYGLLFLCGVPFTSMTQMLPFIIFGIGIDDAIILISSFSRTDSTKDPVQRIADTIDDCGISISLTTITSAVAFGLGCVSSVPAVIWLCYYAAPTIVIVFIFQLTFFVACIVLDDQRMSAGRLDCCICFKNNGFDAAIEKEILDGGLYEPLADQFMVWYANILLRPRVKFVVSVAFTALAVSAAFSTSKLTQALLITDVLPSDSFIIDNYDASTAYTASQNAPGISVYFRDVDQSDKEIQSQMLSFMEDLIAMESVASRPQFFWLWHFNEYVNQTAIHDEPFSDQLASFFSIQAFHDLYSKQIILDDDGNIVHSRGYYTMDGLDLEVVKRVIDALIEQRDVTATQPINQGKEDMPFFSHSSLFTGWEFLARCVNELIVTTIMSVTAVVVIAALLVPHWSAALFALPLICILYIDLLGVLQWAGIHINAVSYIGLAMSIGLLVDFVMHILMRYYECKGTRQEKTKEMLRTMGSSILIGGISTFLGTMPLAFASTRIFYTIFITFLGIVTLGMGHGLILLPVVLSTIGPEDGSPSDSTDPLASSQGGAKRKNIKFEI